jgi:hypothetical protein
VPLALAAVVVGLVRVRRRPGWLFAAVGVGVPWLLLGFGVRGTVVGSGPIPGTATLGALMLAGGLAAVLMVGAAIAAARLARPAS